eukprot:2685333-Rhodomonas_salina.1
MPCPVQLDQSRTGLGWLAQKRSRVSYWPCYDWSKLAKIGLTSLVLRYALPGQNRLTSLSALSLARNNLSNIPDMLALTRLVPKPLSQSPFLKHPFSNPFSKHPCTRYAMPGTDLACTPMFICLRLSYAVSSTELAYVPMAGHDGPQRKSHPRAPWYSFGPKQSMFI